MKSFGAIRIEIYTWFSCNCAEWYGNPELLCYRNLLERREMPEKVDSLDLATREVHIVIIKFEMRQMTKSTDSKDEAENQM